MSEKSIIIIGAGLAGLSTGCYARMNGYRTHIFEHHNIPGGVCTAWNRKGYTLDGCIHWLMSSRPSSAFYQLYDELGAFNGNRVRTITELTRFWDEAGGMSLAVTADLNRLKADMKALASGDSKAIDEFIGACHDLQGLDMEIPKPREVAGFLENLKMVWNLRRVFKYAIRYNMSVAEYARRFRNSFLRRCITEMFVPQMPAYFLFMVLGQLAGGELGVVDGGSRKFSDAIARRYLDLGGEISYNARVEEILVENDRAVGVRLADGSMHRADIVVSAADGYSTIFEMLGGRFVDQGIRDRYANWPLFNPLLIISYGVARQFPGEAEGGSVFLQEPVIAGNMINESMLIHIFNNDPSLAPAGKTVVQAYLLTDFDYWNELQKDRSRYDAEKSRIATDVLVWLEKRYQGISTQVEMTDVATPYTLWRYTRNHRGAFEGWLMTPQSVRTALPKTLPGLGDFFMAGQWVEPGGGIPPALYSGRNLVQLLCKRDGKTFKVGG